MPTGLQPQERRLKSVSTGPWVAPGSLSRARKGEGAALELPEDQLRQSEKPNQCRSSAQGATLPRPVVVVVGLPELEFTHND